MHYISIQLPSSHIQFRIVSIRKSNLQFDIIFLVHNMSLFIHGPSHGLSPTLWNCIRVNLSTSIYVKSLGPIILHNSSREKIGGAANTSGLKTSHCQRCCETQKFSYIFHISIFCVNINFVKRIEGKFVPYLN